MVQQSHSDTTKKHESTPKPNEQQQGSAQNHNPASDAHKQAGQDAKSDPKKDQQQQQGGAKSHNPESGGHKQAGHEAKSDPKKDQQQR